MIMAQKKYTQTQQVIDTLRKTGGYATLGGVSKFTPSFKISQSPNFHKLGLCYSIIFLYLYGKKFLICQRYNLFPI